MGIHIEVISKVMIKPSTPTPQHLCHYKLSRMDQNHPTVYIPMIYFFNNDEKLSNDTSKILKQSLSNILTHYYPLAGCVKDNHVDCNDNGVLFLEARISCQLSQIIKEPVIPCELNKYLPRDHKGDTNFVNDFALAIQVNFFVCGSVAICVHMSHKIADGASLITFVKNWAATARGDGGNICPEFVAATLFPPQDRGLGLNNVFSAKNVVSKRFVFSGSKIAALREKYANTTSSLDQGLYPTRFEALSTFVWNRFASSTQIIKSGSTSGKTCIVLHTVNLRKRIDQPLSDDSFGNLVYAFGIVLPPGNTSEESYCSSLVKSLRDYMGEIKKDYMKRLHDDENAFINLWRSIINKEDLIIFTVSSLCKYPIYDTDFGWGSPLWVVWNGKYTKNTAFFMDTKSGDGIETWIQLNEEDMAKFETDEELLAYTSPIS